MNRPLRVLIVEDSETDAKLVVHELRRAGHTVTSERVQAATALVAALEREKWDIVISDWTMPSFTAGEALERVRAVEPDLPFIIVSGTAGEENAVAAMRAGANDYLVKGDLSRLAPAVERELQQAGLRARRRRAEDALRESEARYRVLFDNSPLPKWLYDRQTLRFLEVNEAAVRHYGWSRDEFLRMTIEDIHRPEDMPAVLESAAQGGSTSSRIRHITKDGSLIEVLVTGVNFPVAGRPTRLAVAHDVTEQRKSEERFKAIFEQAAVGIAEIDPATGALLRANDKLCSILGYSPDDLLSRSWADLVYTETFQPEVRLIPSDNALETRLVRSNGSVLWGRITASPVARRREGASVIAVVEDITGSHLAAEKLRASEQRLASVFRLTRVGLTVARFSDRTILDANDAFFDLVGWSREEVIGRTTLDLSLYVHPEDVATMYEGLLSSGKHPPLEVLIRRKSGEVANVLLTGAAAEIDGEACGIGAWHDVTELRRADAARRESEERFQQVAESMREVFWLTNPEKDKMLYVGPAYERIWGRPVEQIYASPWQWMEAIHPEDRERVKQAATTRQTLGTYDEEYRVRRPDGSIRWIRDRAFPVRDAGGRVTRVAGIAEDITERRNLEDQLRQAQKMEAIGSLAGGVAHDFNNVLSVILSYADMLQAGTEPGSETRADLEEIIDAAKRASGLTRQLLAFSRRQILQPRIVDLNQILAGTERMLQRLIGEDVELSAIPSSSPALVNVDPGQMEQVIMNLAVNARDAMPGGGKLTVEIAPMSVDAALASRHPGASAGPHVMLAVSDNGVGMDAAIQARIFEPFFTTKELGKGTGLGLSTVFGIVRQSAGVISVYSEPGKGSTFKIYLPVAGDGTALEKPGALEAPDLRGSETILLLEDEEPLRRVARSILERSGYRVLEARNGGEALLIMESHPAVHLLITDVVMPRMSGPQVAARLRALQPELKVLYMSGYTDNAVVVNGLLHSQVSFLQKPLTPAALLTKVREVLDAPQAARAPEQLHVLLVHDDPRVQRLVAYMLGGDHVEVARRAVDASILIAGGARFDVVLCDLKLSETSGTPFYDALAANHPQLAARVIFITSGAVGAQASGFVARMAGRILQEPFDAELLRAAIANIIEQNP